MEITYDEIIDILGVKYINGTSLGYVLPPEIYEISDLSSMINCLLPDEGKANITIDDIRQRTKLTTNKILNQ